MTNLTLEENPNLTQTNFKDIKELYNFIIENQIITEIGILSKDNLSNNSKKLLEKSNKSSNLINI